MNTNFLYAMPWFGWIAIAAILCGAISTIVKMLIDHRERMAMIEHGIHPDSRQIDADGTPGANLSKTSYPEL